MSTITPDFTTVESMERIVATIGTLREDGHSDTTIRNLFNEAAYGKPATIAPAKARKAKPAPVKAAKQDEKPVWALTVKERKARYDSNRKFWDGPASKTQQKRVAEQGWEVNTATLQAWQAAELYAEGVCADKGVKFTPIWK